MSRLNWQSIVTYLSITIIAIGILLPALFIIGPWVEHKYFPILVNQEYQVERHGSWVSWVTIQDKQRACKLIDASYNISRIKPVIIEKIPVDVINIPTNAPIKIITFPVGKFQAGPFRVFIPSFFVNSKKQEFDIKIEGIAYYNCGFPWLSYEILGPVKIPMTDTPYGIIEGLLEIQVNPDYRTNNKS
jgi:hypothetical protein